MFEEMTLVTGRKYKVFPCHHSKLISIPKSYMSFRGLEKGSKIFVSIQDNNIIVNEKRVKNSVQVSIFAVQDMQYRFTIPQIIYNLLEDNKKCYYEVYHNSKGLLVYRQRIEDGN